MNYTENFRLPQWEEGDRVMRVDFNRMCGVLEDALTASDRARRRLERLARDAYRQTVQDWMHHGCGGLTDSMWVNALECREAAGGDGHGWNGRYGVSFGPGSLPNVDTVQSSAVEEAYITNAYTEKSLRAAVTFTSDGYGLLEKVGIWSYLNANHNNNQEYSFTIKLTRLDTGELVAEAGPFMSESSYGTNLRTYKTVNFPMEAGVSYRMEYEVPSGSRYVGQGGFTLVPRPMVYSDNPLFFAERETDTTYTGSAETPEGISEAVGLIRWYGGGSVTLSAGSADVKEIATREAVNALGEPCMETEFSVANLPEGKFEVAAHIQRDSGDFTLYDFGLIWK